MKQATKRKLCIFWLTWPLYATWLWAYAWHFWVPGFDGQWWNWPLGLDLISVASLSIGNLFFWLHFLCTHWRWDDDHMKKYNENKVSSAARYHLS